MFCLWRIRLRRSPSESQAMEGADGGTVVKHQHVESTSQNNLHSQFGASANESWEQYNVLQVVYAAILILPVDPS